MEENTVQACAADPEPPFDPATASGGGSPLFVINLCASIAPVQMGGKNLPGLENYRLYQVARVEDGRTRHRLRLGFFTNESHAESVLTVVRQQYPTAFTTCLCDEDRRFARGYLPAGHSAAAATSAPASAPTPKSPTSGAAANRGPRLSPASAQVPAAPAATAARQQRAEPEVVEVSWEPESDAKPAATTGVAGQDRRQDDTAATAKHRALPATPARPPQNLTAKGVAPAPAAPNAASAKRGAPPERTASPQASSPDPAASMRIKAPEFTLSDPEAPKPAPRAASPDQPFHVGRGVDIGDLPIALQPEGAPSAGRSPLPPAPAPVAIGGRTPEPPKPSRTPNLSPPPAPQFDMDSTQTIRALTSAELEDQEQERFFAIQLAASEQPVNLEAMPHLDIFEAYRLYSIASAGSGKIIHSLRLGFFKEAVSAEAVCGYLKTFFGSPSVMRVSAAEHARFKDAPVRRKPNAAEEPKTSASVIELNNARAARPVVPTVTVEVPTPQTEATGAFRALDSGAFKAGASGSYKSGAFKPNATGSFKLNGAGANKVLTPTLKPAAKAAPPPAKRSEPLLKTSATGKYRVPPKKSLSEQLLDEAREVELSASGIRKLPKNGSLLSKLVGKLTK